MDNQTIAGVMETIAVLLEIKGGNPFKVRAYRNAAELITTSAERFADLSEEELQEIFQVLLQVFLKEELNL